MRRISMIVAVLLMAATLAPGQTTPEVGEWAIQNFDTLKQLVSAIEGGVILPFEAQQCPEGWEPYWEGVNRFLIGAGGDFVSGDEGGESRHLHRGRTKGGEGNVAKEDGSSRSPPSADGHRHDFNTDLLETLPPYVGVLFCTPRK